MFDEESVDVLRFFTNLKCRLMPYLYAKAVEARETGLPLMRPMVLEFPDDPTCRWLDRQYMLGDALLVAPVFSPDGEVEYYVPEGRWTHLLSGEEVAGPGWRRETHGYTSLPLLVREGAVMPMGAVEDRPDYDYADGVTLHVFPSACGDSAEVSVPALDGTVSATAVVRRLEDSLVVTVEGGKPWTALLRGWPAVIGAVNAEWEAGPQGVSVRPSDPSAPVDLRLG
jgi:alpha-D-xyloside xylohydrolase